MQALTHKEIKEAGTLRKCLKRGQVDFKALDRILGAVEQLKIVPPTSQKREVKKHDRKISYRNLIHKY